MSLHQAYQSHWGEATHVKLLQAFDFPRGASAAVDCFIYPEGQTDEMIDFVSYRPILKNTVNLSFSLSGIEHSIDDGNTEKPDFDGAQISGPTLACPMFPEQFVYCLVG